MELFYVHSKVIPSERGKIVQQIQSPCAKGDKSKILITTMGLMAEGQNIQRANYCIITEMPGTLDLQTQVKGRIDRTGQVKTPISIQLYDARNLAEAVKYSRAHNRANIINPEDFDIEGFFADTPGST